MRLKIIQFNPYSLHCVYAFQNFMPAEENILINDFIKEITLKDEMNRKTNVKAHMTDYRRLNNEPICKDLFHNIFYTLDSILRLRGKSIDGYTYTVTDSWAMRHKPKDYTINHNHFPGHWSGVFYTYVPDPRPSMEFIEFPESLELESNMLVLFPSILFHKVLENKSDQDRFSLAFNLDLQQNNTK